MINEYIRYKLAPERVDDFLDAYRRAQESLRVSSHCTGYELSRCVEDPTQFILWIRWDSADGHLKGFRTSPEFQVFLQAVRPFMPNLEEMRHYEPTDIRSSG